MTGTEIASLTAKLTLDTSEFTSSAKFINMKRAGRDAPALDEDDEEY